ncbi:MAG: ABC transporter permease [Endomicrobia bacterium]|nr:ABC transporter permease [Endomicrobiia bacterium]
MSFEKLNKQLFFGCIMVSLICLVALIAEYIIPYDPYEQDLLVRLTQPNTKHLFGTDELGRDVFSRMVYATRVSVTVGFIAVGLATLIGTFLGIISGYYGGIVDNLIMRLVDVMLCFPTFFLILLVIAFVKPSIYNIMIVIGLTSWPSLTRYIRAEVLKIKSLEFVLSAKLAGFSSIRIMFVHILPNVLIPILVNFSLGIGSAILTESALSFLGLGVQPPQPSWGNILSSGKDYIHIAWWLSIFPGLAIFVTVVAFNLLAEGFRTHFSPKEKQ